MIVYVKVTPGEGCDPYHSFIDLEKVTDVRVVKMLSSPTHANGDADIWGPDAMYFHEWFEDSPDNACVDLPCTAARHYTVFPEF